MRRHLLRELTATAIAQILCDSRRTEGVIADSGLDPRRDRPPANHSIDIRLGEGIGRQPPGPATRAAEKVALAVLGYPRSGNIGIQVDLEVVVTGHLMPLAAFLVQPDPPPTPLRVVVLDPHLDHRADAAKGVDHGCDESPIT